MQKESATNTFNKGLVMDFNPIVLPQNTLCNALNATIITMNGNENVLLNDMGNGRVETAYLPEGFIPLGSAELGGIIYIVSYNPLIDRCLIGSFPSPERNITSKELDSTDQSIEEKELYSSADSDEINSPYTKLELTDFKLHPGDKYVIVCPAVEDAKTSDDYSYISALGENYNFNSRLLPRYLRFSVVAISSNGQVIDMSDSCVWLKLLNYDGYYILNTTGGIDTDTGKVDLDEYRDLVTSQYNVFACKHSGKLGILTLFECIDTFEIAWDALKFKGEDEEKEVWHFYFYTNWTYENDLEPDKINLFGIRYSGDIDEKPIDGGDIIIENYPILYRSVTGPIYGTCIATTDIMGNDMPGLTISSTTANKLKYVKSDSDYYDFEFLTPYYIEDLPIDYLENGIDPYSLKIIYEDDIVIDDIINNGITLSRRNDGSDNQFLICDPVTIDTDEGILKLNIKPLMPYGALNWLQLSFTIDLSKLGSGIIDLVEYRYYILNGKVTLNWGLDAYPERNRKINGVTFNFYKIEKYSDENESCNIINWIENNLYTLDNCKVVNGTWIDQKTEEDASTETFSVYDEDGSKLDEEGYICHYFPEIKNCGSIEVNGYTELPDYCTSVSFPTSSKSSYSGHFTENLIIYQEDEVDNPDEYLIEGKTYLLEIDVDYNDNSIKYYRIFYTQPIFNNYFYNNDYIDYAKIDLNDELNPWFDTEELSLKKTYSDIYIYKMDGESHISPTISEIPSYNNKIDTVDYHIDNYSGVDDLNFLINCSTKYDLFNIDIIKVESTDIYIEPLLSDLNKVPFNNTNSTRTDWPINEPTFTINLNSPNGFNCDNSGVVSGSYEIITHNPMRLIYDKEETPAAQYELAELDYRSLFICGSGSNYSAEIWICDRYQYRRDSSSPFFNTGDYMGGSKKGDDQVIALNINGISSLYDFLNGLLDDSDILLLGCVENYTNTYDHGHNEGWFVEFGYGSYKLYVDSKDTLNLREGNDYWSYKNTVMQFRAVLEDDKFSKGGLFLCYAMRSNSSIVLFTIDSGLLESWYNTGVNLTYDRNYDFDNYGNLPGFSLVSSEIIKSDDDLNIDIAFAPFKALRKLKTTGKTTNTIYRFSTAYYYEKFTETDNINIDGDITISLKINKDIIVPGDLKVNNLHYKNKINTVIIYSIVRRIDNSTLIEPVLSYSDYFTIDKYGNIVGSNLNANKLYQVTDDKTKEELGKEYNSIPNRDGLDSDLTITRNSLSNYLRIDGIPSDQVNILWAYEELAVAIKNIYII